LAGDTRKSLLRWFFFHVSFFNCKIFAIFLRIPQLSAVNIFFVNFLTIFNFPCFCKLRRFSQICCTFCDIQMRYCNFCRIFNVANIFPNFRCGNFLPRFSGFIHYRILYNVHAGKLSRFWGVFVVMHLRTCIIFLLFYVVHAVTFAF